MSDLQQYGKIFWSKKLIIPNAVYIHLGPMEKCAKFLKKNVLEKIRNFCTHN